MISFCVFQRPIWWWSSGNHGRTNGILRPPSLFTKDSVMGDEVSHPGGGGRLAPVSIWSNYLLHSGEEMRLCSEESPRSGRETLLPWLSFSGCGAGSSPFASALSPGQACPQQWGHKGAQLSAWNAGCSARAGHLQRAKLPLINLCWTPFSSWWQRRETGLKGMSVFSEIKINWYMPSELMD